MKTAKKKIKDDTIARMKALGVFKPEFEDAIDTYADLYFQYKNISKQFNKDIKNEEKCKAVIVEYSAARTTLINCHFFKYVKCGITPESKGATVANLPPRN